MTDIEQKAQSLINTITKLKFNGNIKFTRSGYMAEALCRAIEQHEAFRQEVSDAMQRVADGQAYPSLLLPFIIPKPKPDPLVGVAESMGYYGDDAIDLAEEIRVALEARGLEIREKNDD